MKLKLLIMKEFLRKQIAAEAAKRLNCPVIYLNQVGGNDELQALESEGKLNSLLGS